MFSPDKRKPNAEEILTKGSTMQGVKSPVPAAVSGGQVNPGSPTSDCCSTMGVDHVASLADNVSSDVTEVDMFQKSSVVQRYPL